MIFSELYGCYYTAVANILRIAVKRPPEKEELRRIISKSAFAESILQIEPALSGSRWQLLHPDHTTPLRHPPTMPLSTLQKRWLKAISLDPRIKLFPDALPPLPDAEPLFTPADWFLFDRYGDGDPYTDAGYIARFRLILDAVRKQYPLRIEQHDRHGCPARFDILPDYLEYSEKDDKFRLVGHGAHTVTFLNLARITACAPCEAPFTPCTDPVPSVGRRKTVEFILYDQRNALDRVLLHFAHFEKETEKMGNGTYTVRLRYDAADETELLIRILSFGPMIRVTSPAFAELVRERLRQQMLLDGLSQKS